MTRLQSYELASKIAHLHMILWFHLHNTIVMFRDTTKFLEVCLYLWTTSNYCGRGKSRCILCIHIVIIIHLQFFCLYSSAIQSIDAWLYIFPVEILWIGQLMLLQKFHLSLKVSWFCFLWTFSLRDEYEILNYIS